MNRLLLHLPDPRNSPVPPLRSRGFTLLEVLLATAIGSMVLIIALAMFTGLSRAQRSQEIRTDQNAELALTYTALERAMRLLVMAEEPDVGNDTKAKERIGRDIARNEGQFLPEDQADLESARLLITTDPGPPVEIIPDQPFHPQTLRLCLKAPALSGGIILDQEVHAAQSEHERQRQQRIRERREARLAKRQGASTVHHVALLGPGAGGTTTPPPAPSPKPGNSTNTTINDPNVDRWEKALRDLDAGGNTGSNGFDMSFIRDLINQRLKEARDKAGQNQQNQNNDNQNQDQTDDPDADTRNNGLGGSSIDDPDTPVRAPGVRAEFILLPDDQEPEQALSSENNDRPTASFNRLSSPVLDDNGNPLRGLSLWYVELAPRSSSDSPALDFETFDTDAPTSSRRAIRLASGLSYAKWQVFRSNRFDSQIAAHSARELPSHVELEIVTLQGRREKWMFEVAWSTGLEPGQIQGKTRTSSPLPTR